MPVNMLTDNLPETVMIGGTEYPIEWGFRTSILFELMMQDSSLEREKKAQKALNLYFPTGIPNDIDGAVKAILWFYSCGLGDKNPEFKKKLEQSQGEEEKKEDPEEEQDDVRAYSYDYDDAYIYAAFKSQYGIDLVDIDDYDLHWWKFRALFKSLHEDEEIIKIIGYRTAKPEPKMSQREKDFLRKMKRIYALPRPIEEIEQEEALTYALLNGGDLTGLL